MTIKDFYLNEYPTDELGIEIDTKATFAGLVTQLFGDGDVYDYIGVHDSLVRERLFSELAKQLNKPYDFVYNLWLN
mgnify:FL=1|tara:strand:+ start:205 stop:432 length:228 start_codon:yes stop_codon:yes gene_type:complete